MKKLILGIVCLCLISCGKQPVPQFDPPINLNELGGSYLWPYGAHGGGDANGHPGIDFITAKPSTVYAPADGVVFMVKDATEGAVGGKRIDISAGDNINYSLQHVVLDSGIGEGSVIKKGQRIGDASYDSNSKQYAVHFQVGLGNNEVCPAQYLSQDSINRLGLNASDPGSIMSLAVYDTKPTESQLCNPR